MVMARITTVLRVLSALLFLRPKAAAQLQAPGNINLGSSLVAGGNNSWLSPSGDFAFGFRPLQKPQIYMLAIWFDKMPEKTVVWCAKGQPGPLGEVPNLVTTQTGATLTLTSKGQLLLLEPTGLQTIWSADVTNGTSGASYAAMLDTGNFVLAGGMSRAGSQTWNASSSRWLWESFLHQTDTLLPGQVVHGEGRLWARRDEEDYKNGRFILRAQSDGNLVFYAVDPLSGLIQYDPYWASGTTNGTNLTLTESGYLTYFMNEGRPRQLTTMPVDSVRTHYHRVILEHDGVLRQYVYPRNPQRSGEPPSWRKVWHLPDNICIPVMTNKGSGVCGYNSICKINDSRPVCTCIPGYSPIDDTGAAKSGCKPDVAHGCSNASASDPALSLTYDLVELPNVDFPEVDYEGAGATTEQDCVRYLEEDCLCDAAVIFTNGCWKKQFPLANGREDSRYSGKTFLKVWKRATNASLDSEKKTKFNGQATWILVLSIISGLSVLIGVLFLLAALHWRRAPLGHGRRGTNPEVRWGSNCNDRLWTASTICVYRFTFDELQFATDGFKEELGHGSFGTVYKGWVNEETPVAVKRLDGKMIQRGEKEFQTEVSLIGRTHHRNLVKLLGYCDEGEHRLLVYEYMPNGTLASYLFRPLRPPWSQRLELAASVARGLAYLHEECGGGDQIIHCDIKPQNVLLDGALDARISDFGLAKLLKADMSRTCTDIRGTRGYVAPEWFRNAAVTVKVDVYSFGVLLLEAVCCRRSIEDVGEEEGEVLVLVDLAWDCYHEGRVAKLVEEDDAAFSDLEGVERAVKVALWCVQEEPSLRPSMKKVALMLEGLLEVRPPPVPFFVSYTMG